MKNPVSSSPSNFNPSTKTAAATTTTTVMDKSSGDNSLIGNEGSTSSISDYLMEMLPGWHVEDFLDSSETAFGFCKTDDGMLPFFDTDIDSNMTTSSQESSGPWVPQSPFFLYSSQMGGTIGFKETKEITSTKANKRWTSDAFTLPQIIPPSIGSKRSRPLW